MAAKMKIRRDDTVVVVAGNDRGKTGRVLLTLRDKGRVVVEGVNMRWKHMPKSQEQPEGGRVQREAPIHVSNVQLYNQKEGRPVRRRADL